MKFTTLQVNCLALSALLSVLAYLALQEGWQSEFTGCVAGVVYAVKRMADDNNGA